jgi:hypothetical protein
MSNCISLDEKRDQYQLKMLARHFPWSKLQGIAHMTPQDRKSILKLLVMYVNASPEDQEALHAYIRKERLKEKTHP